VDVDVELIDCACYTTARRHPEVLGRIGRTVLPFQLTAPALVSGVLTFIVLLLSWASWWNRLVPGVVALMVVVGVPVALGRLAMVTSLGGRNPFLAAGGVLRYLFGCRGGLIAGRPMRRASRRRLTGRVIVGGTS
jgi:hypothetical protein